MNALDFEKNFTLHQGCSTKHPVDSGTPWVICGWLLKYLESYDMVQVRPPDELTVIPADEAPVVSGPTVRHFNPATVWP